MVTAEIIIDGDFASEEVTRLRDEADIIVTNPPFSLFRKFLAWIMEGQKQFLILGSMNAITYKEVFPLIRDNQIWLGTGANMTLQLQLPDDAEKYKVMIGDKKYASVPTCTWFTNIDHAWRHKQLNYVPIDILTATGVTFNKYDNYDAIDVPKCMLIPDDYDGVMGVPVSFLTQYNPDQFEIVAFRKGEDGKDLVFTRERENSTVLSYPCSTAIAGMIKNAEGMINGKPTYARILIQRKNL